VCDQNN